MAKKEPVDPPDLGAFFAKAGDARNRLLLAWLSDDAHRAALFALINAERGGILEFPSRDASPADCCPDDEHPRRPPEVGHKTVYLVTGRDRIEEALVDGGRQYSNRLYGDLGGGNFLLALDPATSGATAHAAQAKALCDCFRSVLPLVPLVSHHACQSAAILSLQTRDFDLATFAEQAALRFCQSLFGYVLADYLLLERALGAGYQALVYQVLGRHFATDPALIAKAKEAMGALLARTSALLDAYAAPRDDDALKDCDVAGAFSGLKRVLETLANLPGELNGEQRAIIAAGAVTGTVGNVQAAVCIAVQFFFADTNAWRAARALVASEDGSRATVKQKEWRDLIRPALRANPPIPFLPRVVIPAMEGREAFSEIILALGGATGDSSSNEEVIWGLPPTGRHWCSGRDLAWPLIVEGVRHVMGLPGLAQRRDPLDASVMKLEKRWGFACKSYPLTHRRDARFAQSSLNVAMRIKFPQGDSAGRLREVIRAGAPRIDEVLHEARHVHFAWFEFIERDTVLVLHTVYDGDFASYVQHFALRVGDLFDKLFEYIEDAPPRPVADFPDDFVAHIQRHNRAPAVGYFFSAYPRSEAARIMRDEAARR